MYTCSAGHSSYLALSHKLNPTVGGEGWGGGARDVMEVREGVGIMLEMVKKSSEELGKAFGCGARVAPARVICGGYGGAEFREGKKGVAKDIESMFMGKIEVYGGLEFTRESVVAGILKISLKGMLEAVREGSFSCKGLSQLMVDLGCVRQVLPHYIQGHLALDGTIDKIIQSGKERCFEEGGVVEGNVRGKIIANWLERQRKVGEDSGGGALIWD